MGVSLGNKGNANTGIISAVNSSTTALNNGSTFSGSYEFNLLPDIAFVCKTDTSGTLTVYFSPDGENDDSSLSFKIKANTNEIHTLTKGPRWTKVIFDNDSGANQTFLRLYVYYGSFRGLNSPLNSIINDNANTVIVRSVDTGIDLAFNRFGGMTEDSKFGSCLDMDSADAPFDIWWPSGDNVSNLSKQKTFPATDGPIYIAASTAAATGKVLVPYLNAEGSAVSTTVSLNGATGVLVASSALDCNRAVVVSGAVGDGPISVATTASFSNGVPSDITKLLAYIPAGKGQTQQSMDTVPVNKKRRIKRVFIFCSRAAGAAGSATVEFQIMTDGLNWITKRVYPVTTSVPVDSDVAGLVLNPLTKHRFRCISASDGDTIITAECHYDDVEI